LVPASRWSGDRARDLLEGTMMIDCDACAARGPACGDCVVTVLLGTVPVRRPGEGEWSEASGDTTAGIDLDGNEQAAIAVLAGSGLIPPLRLVPATPESAHDHSEHCAQAGQNTGDRHHPDNRPGDDHRTAV
jgi:hypothetical protein